MAIGVSRRTSYGRELNGWGGIFTTTTALASAAATTLLVASNGGPTQGVPTLAVGQKVSFLGIAEAPKTISAVSGTGPYTLTIPALVNAIPSGSQVVITAPITDALLVDTFSSKKNRSKWSPTPYSGTRAKNISIRSGRIEVDGAMEFMLRPSVNAIAIARSVGYDAVTGSTPTNPNTLNGATLVGATSVTLTLATGYTVNGIIQVDTGANAECRKITAVASNVLTLDKPLNYAHSNGAATNVVVAPFTHTIPSATSNLPSVVLEDYIPYDDANQVNGLTVLSYLLPGAIMKSLKVESQTETGIKVNVDYIAQDKVSIGAFPALAIPSETVFNFTQEAVLLAGSQVFRITEANFELDNDLQKVFAKNGSARLFALKAGLQDVKGSFKFLEDQTTQTQFWNALEADTLISFQWTITDAVNNNIVTFNIPKIMISEFEDGSFNPGDLIYATLNFMAQLDAGGTNAQINMTIQNQDYVTY